MTLLNWILLVIIIVLVLLPTKWDPAILLKQRNEERRKALENDR